MSNETRPTRLYLQQIDPIRLSRQIQTGVGVCLALAIITNRTGEFDSCSPRTCSSWPNMPIISQLKSVPLSAQPYLCLWYLIIIIISSKQSWFKPLFGIFAWIFNDYRSIHIARMCIWLSVCGHWFEHRKPIELKILTAICEYTHFSSESPRLNLIYCTNN